LKTALVEHIITLSQESPLDILVIRRICLALAVLALQLNQPGVVNEILAYMNPIIATSPIILLELLTVLPEECFNRHIDVENSIREEFSAQLSSSAPQVLEFLTSFANPQVERNHQTQIQLLRCFSRWIENTRISQTLLAQHPLLQFTISGLSHPVLFEEATDVIISLFRQYAGPLCLDEEMVLPAVLVPIVISLSSLWQADQIARNEHDEEVCRAVSRLFTEMVESYLYLLTQQFDIGQDRIMEQMLVCAAYPWSSEIARIPLKGFYELSAFIKNSGQERDELIQRFGSYFCRLVRIVVQQLKLSDEIFLSDERLAGEDLYARDELKESLVDVMDVIGPDTVMQIIVEILQQNAAVINMPLSPSASQDLISGWELIESALVGVSVIANYLSMSDRAAASLAFITEFLVKIRSGMQPELSSLENIRNSVIGKCASYLSFDQRHLPELLNLVCAGLLRASVASSSALALMLLLQNCEASHQLLPLESFYGQICQLRVAGSLPIPCDLDILEGLCVVVSRMTLADAKQTLQFLLEPIINSLLSNVEKNVSSKLVMDDIERITILMSKTAFPEINYAQQPEISHPVVDIFLAISPFFGQILQRYPSESVAEKVCRCYKHFLNNVSLCSLSLLDSLLSHVIGQYQLHSYSCYLYVCSIAVKIFGESLQLVEQQRTNVQSRPSLIPFSSLQNLLNEDGTVLYQHISLGQVKATLHQMFQQIVQIFFTRHSSLQQFEDNPDLVEEFYYLMARVLQVIPILYLDSSHSSTVVTAAIVGLNLNHREAQKGILLFVQRIVEIPHSLRNERSTPFIEAIRGRSQKLLMEIMPSLVNQLLHSLSGQIPSYALDESYGSISDVLWSLKQFSSEHFQVPLPSPSLLLSSRPSFSAGVSR
jgi:transportin-3